MLLFKIANEQRFTLGYDGARQPGMQRALERWLSNAFVYQEAEVKLPLLAVVKRKEEGIGFEGTIYLLIHCLDEIIQA